MPSVRDRRANTQGATLDSLATYYLVEYYLLAIKPAMDICEWMCARKGMSWNPEILLIHRASQGCQTRKTPSLVKYHTIHIASVYMYMYYYVYMYMYYIYIHILLLLRHGRAEHLVEQGSHCHLRWHHGDHTKVNTCAGAKDI